MTTAKPEEAANDLLAALRALPRKHYEFEVNGLVGLDRQPVHKVAIRVATKKEQDAAIKAADDYIHKLADKSPTLVADPDVVYDARAAYIIASVVREAARPDKMPVFPTGDEVVRLLTTDRIAALLALVNYVRELESPNKSDVSEEKVDNIVALCKMVGDSPIVEQALAGLTRPELEGLCIKLGLRLSAPPPDPEPVEELDNVES